MIKTIIFLITLLVSPLSHAVLMSCEDRIEKMKSQKEKEGPGSLADENCKSSQRGKRAIYGPKTRWECKTVEDFPCVHNKKLKMVQCDREFVCVK